MDIFSIINLLGGLALFLYGVVIPIIMGQNIGTCVTSVISSIGVNKNAKRVAVVCIAIIHSLFNIFTTVIIFPFAEKLVPISHKFVCGDEDEEMEVFLDERLLITPSIAVEEAMAKTSEMVEIAFQNFRDAITLLSGYNYELFEKIKIALNSPKSMTSFRESIAYEI